MIKNIIFDLGNVLLLFNEKEIISHFTNNKEESEYISKEIIRSPEWNMLDKGTISLDDAINKVNEKNNNKYRELTENFWRNYVNYQLVNENTVSILKYLKYKGYKIYILSNLSEMVYNHFKDHELFNYVDGKIISYQYKTIKPEYDIYNILLNKYNLIADECIFIDDKIENIKAANDLNIHGEVVNKDDSTDVFSILNKYFLTI